MRIHLLSPSASSDPSSPVSLGASAEGGCCILNSFIISPTTLINKSRSSTNCSRSPWLRNTSWLMTVSRSPGAKVSLRMTRKPYNTCAFPIAPQHSAVHTRFDVDAGPVLCCHLAIGTLRTHFAQSRWVYYVAAIRTLPATPTMQWLVQISRLLAFGLPLSISPLADFDAQASRFPWQCPIQRPVLLQCLRKQFC